MSASKDSPLDRRSFIKVASAAGAGLAVAGRAAPLFAHASPNERVVVAIMGLNGRGQVHAENFAVAKNAEVGYVCDVDSRVLAASEKLVASKQPRAPKAIVDFRRALDDKDVDALVIAAPDHWHTPAAILAMQAGKHVYVEKPCGHDAREGELIVAAQRKHGRVAQMGNQQRSAPRSIEAMQLIHGGAIGKVYLARAWYANARGPIGRGKTVPVPANLDYELWQGPAPRTPFRDNVVHYNWHWFRRWGTGEICNNGTHEIDIARWALGVEHPTRVSSVGSRHHFDDDWEFPDNQEVTFEFEGGRTIVWQGQSCNALPTFGRGRGTAIVGTTGSIVLDRDGYVLYDVKGKPVREVKETTSSDGLNLVGDDAATSAHMANFAEAIRTGAALRSPISEGATSLLLCHLGNIAQYTGRKLRIDPATGHIIGDTAAMKHWSREYAPGWAPRV